MANAKDDKTATTTNKPRTRKPRVPVSRQLTQLKNTLRADAKKSGMDKDELETILAVLTEQVRESEKQVVSKKQNERAEQWKQLDEMRLQFIAGVEKLGTELSPAEVLKMPAYFNYQDEQKKQHKARDETADWLQKQLAGKTKDQRAKILEKHKKTANENKAEFFSKYVDKIVKTRDAKRASKEHDALIKDAFYQAIQFDKQKGGISINTHGLNSWAFNASLLNGENMTLERVDKYKHFFIEWFAYLSDRAAKGLPHPEDHYDFIKSKNGQKFRDFMQTQDPDKDDAAIKSGAVVSVTDDPETTERHATTRVQAIRSGEAPKKRAAKKKVTKKKNP